ncbi:MAG: hypothetical protein D6763_10260, partial [Alphaproteobacteria bacterium]
MGYIVEEATVMLASVRQFLSPVAAVLMFLAVLAAVWPACAHHLGDDRASRLETHANCDSTTVQPDDRAPATSPCGCGEADDACLQGGRMASEAVLLSIPKSKAVTLSCEPPPGLDHQGDRRAVVSAFGMASPAPPNPRS